MGQKFANNARALLLGAITAGDTAAVITSAAADRFPTANANGLPVNNAVSWFKATLEDSAGNVEIVIVRTRAGGSNLLQNMLRGQDGTTARAFAAGSVVSQRATAAEFETLLAAVGSLSTPVAIAEGGTSATTASKALQNLGLIDIGSEISVVAATALDATAIGKSVLIGDASPAVGDYGVSLPPGAPVGSMVLVRISPTATKLYTLGSLDVTIDGEFGRIMWRGESALVLREPGPWTKISGVTRPFVGGFRRITAQTGLATGVYTQVAFTSVFGDPTGLYLPYKLSTLNWQCPRKGSYLFNGNLSIAGTGIAGAGVAIAILANASVPGIEPSAQVNDIVVTGAVRYMGIVSGVFRLNYADGVGLAGNIGSGTAIQYEYSSTIAPALTYAEQVTW